MKKTINWMSIYLQYFNTIFMELFLYTILHVVYLLQFLQIECQIMAIYVQL